MKIRIRDRLQAAFKVLAGNRHDKRNTAVRDIETTAASSNSLLAGKNVLITGAGSNIGKAVAIEMARQGARIYFTDISEDICRKANGEILAHCPSSRWFLADVSRKEDTDSLCRSLSDDDIRIDILVNNVGVQVRETAQNFEWEEWQSVFATNCFGPLYLSRLISRTMRQNSVNGSILFLSSIHQWTPFRFASYSSSKAALGMAIQELAIDLSPYGIRVNGIAPGRIGEDEHGSPLPSEFSLLGKTSISPTYIGRAAVYLASDYFSRFTTGSVLTIDAGLSLNNFRVAQYPPEV